MTGSAAEKIREEARFRGIERFVKPVRLVSSGTYGSGIKDEIQYVKRASGTTRADVARENPGWPKQPAAVYTGGGYAVKVRYGSGQAVEPCSRSGALRLALRMAAARCGGDKTAERCGTGTADRREAAGCLGGRRVFCPDFAREELAAVIVDEGGEPVFVDASPDDWGMDPEALARAFERYPDGKLVIAAHVYGFPCRIDEIRERCRTHGALLIEDASDAPGAEYKGQRTGSFGDYAVLDPGREDSAGQIRAKRRIYERYAEGLEALDIWMNPYDEQNAKPDYRVSCMTISENGLSRVRWSMRDGVWRYAYEDVHGRTCPPELCDALNAFGAEGRPVWSPLHLRPRYRKCGFVTADEEPRDQKNGDGNTAEAAYLSERSLCLPSDAGMTEEEQERVIEIIYACFNCREWKRAVGDHGLF